MITAKKSRSFRWIIGILLLVVTFFVVGMPLLKYLNQLNSTATSTIQPIEELSPVEAAQLMAMQFFTAVWVFAFGAAIGSYINVLVYRLPLSKSVFWERSHCPNCNYQIAGRDNLPILSWLMLNGKCRNCGQPIASRYPMIEAFAGAIFLTLFFWQTLSGGWNIPVRNINVYHGFVWVIFYTKWDLIGLLLWHSFLFYSLLTWWLIERDGQLLPRYSVFSAWGIVLSATVIWPDLLPVKLMGQQVTWLAEGSQWSGIVSSLVGLAAGYGLGIGLSALFRQFTDLLFNKTSLYLSLTGSILGWQAVILIALAWTICLLAKFVFIRKVSLNTAQSHCELLILIGVHHLFWRNLYEIMTDIGT